VIFNTRLVVANLYIFAVQENMARKVDGGTDIVIILSIVAGGIVVVIIIM